MPKGPSSTRTASDLQKFGETVFVSAVEVFVNGLSTFIEEHERFEILNGKKRRRQLTDSVEIGEWVKYQSVFMAHFLSCRRLDDFLSRSPPGQYKDDAFAEMLVSDPVEWRKRIKATMPIPKAVREEANKNLFHLTFSDKLMATAVAEFNSDYTIFVFRGLEAFLIAVKGGHLAEHTRQTMLSWVSEARTAYERMIVKAPNRA